MALRRGKAERLPELVRLKVDILVTAAQGASLAAQKATATIPIVVMFVADPVGVGLVKSLTRHRLRADCLPNSL